MSSEVVQVQRHGGWFWSVITVVVVLTLLGAVLSRVAIDYGWYTPGWMEAVLTPVAPTVRALPTTEPRPTYPPAPTIPPAAPTALPQGQPAIQADPAAPLPAMAAPVAGPNPAAPATIKTREPVCFAGWWYVEGQNIEISCSGTGGD